MHYKRYKAVKINWRRGKPLSAIYIWKSGLSNDFRAVLNEKAHLWVSYFKYVLMSASVVQTFLENGL